MPFLEPAAHGQARRSCVITHAVDPEPLYPADSLNMIALAERLSLSGAEVTLFWTKGDQESAESVQSWADHYRQRYGIRLEIFRHPDQLAWRTGGAHYVSYGVYEFLKAARFDDVHVPLEEGAGYYALMAKETGVFPDAPRITVIAHAPMQWRAEADRYFYWELEQLKIEFMERYCASAADQLITMSDGLLAWMRQRGWEVAPASRALPAMTPLEWEAADGAVEEGAVRREIVLLATASFSEGITLFCDAMDRLDGIVTGDVLITLAGHFGKILGEHTGGMILRRSRNWKFRLLFLPKAGLRAGLDHARQRGAVVVLPNYENACGYAVSECLRLGVPFVATNVSGNAAHFPGGSGAEYLAEPAAGAIAEAIARRLEDHALPPGSWHFKRSSAAWRDAVIDGPAAHAPEGKAASGGLAQPLVSVVMTHHDRPQYFLQALASVRDQDYANIEVIVVDDGSKRPDSHAMLDGLEAEFGRKGWKLIRTENRYVGAARNTGVRASRGDYIVFVDDDNALFPSAVSTFVSAILKCGAEVCTAMSTSFFGDNVPGSGRFNRSGWVPLGPSPDVNFIEQVFGDTMSIYRRTVFETVGYQFEKFGYMVEDYEFFVRIMLAGLKIRVIPESLFWYRVSTQGRYRSSHWYDNQIPILEAYARAGFKGLDSLYKLVLGQNIKTYSKESYRQNLTYSASDRQYLDLTDMKANSDEALELLARIAAKEGRPDTAIGLLAHLPGRAFEKESLRALKEQPAALTATRELWRGVTRQKRLTLQDLLSMQVLAASAGAQPVSYAEEPDRLFLECARGEAAIAVSAACAPAGTVRVRCKVSLSLQDAEETECVMFLCPMHDDPAVALSAPGAVHRERSSGWRRLGSPAEPVALEIELPLPLDAPMNLVLGMRSPPGESGSVLASFEAISMDISLEDVSAQRPRLGAPPHRQRARHWSDAERRSAHLLTPYPSDLPLLLFPREPEGGVFLRPSPLGPVVAAIDNCFPAFARQLRAEVEIAHEEASPFEFAIALTPPDAKLDWKAAGPSAAVAFSGWVRVEEKFRRREIRLKLLESMPHPLTITLGIRLPRGSRAQPSNAFWRTITFHWEE